MPDDSETSSKRETQNGRSTVEFPYSDLDNSVEVAKAVHNVGGTGCEWVQLAVHMGQSATGGGFRLRAMSARSYGLIDYDRGNVSLTELGLKACDPRSERAAKVEAFLRVPAFKAMYDRLKGNLLPPPVALEKMLVDIGVTPKQKDKVRQVFLRSATQAGFRDADQERLVAPHLGHASATVETKVETSTESLADESKKKLLRTEDELHPFVEGLLKTLPKAGDEWTITSRVKWLQAASNIFGLIYTEGSADEGTEIEIKRKNGS